MAEVCRDFKIDGAKLDKVGEISLLSDLKAAAQKFGLKAKLSYLYMDKLDSVKGPYIAHLFGDHSVFLGIQIRIIQFGLLIGLPFLWGQLVHLQKIDMVDYILAWVLWVG